MKGIIFIVLKFKISALWKSLCVKRMKTQQQTWRKYLQKKNLLKDIHPNYTNNS